MPAVSSSPISAALEQLSRLPASDRALLSGQCPGLTEYLELDPRPLADRRHCTTSAMSATAKTPPRSAPAADPRPWPPYLAIAS